MRKKIVNEWVRKAEEDFESAVYLAKRRKKHVPDAVCFHAQQCIEKYLKAFLVDRGIEPPAIHDLQRLRNICEEVAEGFRELSEHLDVLNAYAVSFRYPGEEATVEESLEAVSIMKKARQFLRTELSME